MYALHVLPLTRVLAEFATGFDGTVNTPFFQAVVPAAELRLPIARA